uniref:Gag polyprotein n=1 Tax=Anoplophora glabripennis TaxID=217634 RepID=V5GNH6_ANOGL
MASLKMDINRLKKDELIFELAIRGVTCDETKTVDELRTCLRPLLRLEKSDTSLSYPEYNLNIDDELKTIRDKCLELQGLLDKLLSGTLKQSPEVIRSRLYHVLHRIDQMPTSSLTSEQSQLRSAYLSDSLKLLDFLDNFMSRDVAGGYESVFSEAAAQGNVSVDSIVDPAASALNSTRSPPPPSSSQPVQKWNLKFSGDPKGLSVHNFLERVQELSIARNVSVQQVFESAIDLFEGKALLWFRSNKDRVSNWEELRRLLIRHYEPPDYKERLFDEILSRTQDPSESFIEYFSCMLSMFRRYGTVAEDVQLRLITRNLAPFYIMQLPVVNSLSELEDECLKLEKKKYRADNYRPPARKRNTYVEPDFAFVGTSNSRSISSSIELNEVRSNGDISGNCYNCGQLGHRFRNCSAARRIFCFKCGKVGVTVRKCPTCNPSGNVPGRH